MKKTIYTFLTLSLIGLYSYGADQGPVATACKTEIEKHCANKQHVAGEVRNCLEAVKNELSKSCLTVLENTGPGKGNGQGMKKAKK